MSIGPAHIVAARTAVSLAGALTRAIGTAAEGVVAGAKPTFEQILAGQTESAPHADPPTIVNQLVDRIKNLFSGAGIELAAPVSFTVSAAGTLVVDGKHPQRESLETAIAHDQSIEQLVAHWGAASDPSKRREPLGLTIAPGFHRPAGF